MLLPLPINEDLLIPGEDDELVGDQRHNRGGWRAPAMADQAGGDGSSSSLRLDSGAHQFQRLAGVRDFINDGNYFAPDIRRNWYTPDRRCMWKALS